MFEKASRMKLRIATVKGNISTEDLWDLPLTARNGFSLDNIAKSLNQRVSNEEVSFVTKKSSADEALVLAFEIVKHIIEIKLAEREEQVAAKEKAEKRDKILAIIQKKQDESLENMDIDALKNMLDSL